MHVRWLCKRLQRYRPFICCTILIQGVRLQGPWWPSKLGALQIQIRTVWMPLFCKVIDRSRTYTNVATSSSKHRPCLAAHKGKLWVWYVIIAERSRQIRPSIRRCMRVRVLLKVDPCRAVDRTVFDLFYCESGYYTGLEAAGQKCPSSTKAQQCSVVHMWESSSWGFGLNCLFASNMPF